MHNYQGGKDKVSYVFSNCEKVGYVSLIYTVKVFKVGIFFLVFFFLYLLPSIMPSL